MSFDCVFYVSINFKKQPKMSLSPEQVAQAVLLVEQGQTQREVAPILNVSRSNLKYALKRYRETGLFTRRPGSGGVRCASARDDRFSVRGAC